MSGSDDIKQEDKVEQESPAEVTRRYNLPGPQIEPGAAFWADRGKRIAVVEVDALPDGTMLPYDRDPEAIEADIRELIYLAEKRDEQGLVIAGGTFEGRIREPLSKFLYLRPAPLGAIFNVTVDQPKVTDLFTQCGPSTPLVQTGRELARLFEDETPGLLHRHALNCLLFRSNISPPRQARIWMALDVTIYSALLAAWHFKWANINGKGHPDFERVYRERPIEYEIRRAAQMRSQPRFEVLYDRQVRADGTGDGAPRCNDPNVPSPGSPRHPAYPSGHSTYSAAASEVLTYFFPDERAELERLADNIGMARLWSAVHWRDDHKAGRALGLAVAERIKAQLIDDPVRQLTSDNLKPRPCDTTPRPDFQQVRADGRKIRNPGNPKNPHQDEIPPRPEGVADIQGSQRGAL
ncbi:phosphatase PAP2 family protein [Pseudoroseomonas globiformis]|uniref:Phosphatase PAP2 family protein n=1 Tax=Teichococcus globiformis TaxID=2307229 RepID=A0ABV7G7N5_9PROT